MSKSMCFLCVTGDISSVKGLSGVVPHWGSCLLLGMCDVRYYPSKAKKSGLIGEKKRSLAEINKFDLYTANNFLIMYNIMD